MERERRVALTSDAGRRLLDEMFVRPPSDDDELGWPTGIDPDDDFYASLIAGTATTVPVGTRMGDRLRVDEISNAIQRKGIYTAVQRVTTLDAEAQGRLGLL